MTRVTDERLAQLIDALCELQERRKLAGPMAPIARVTVPEDFNSRLGTIGCVLYAPGLPPGEHDVYPEPPQHDLDRMDQELAAARKLWQHLLEVRAPWGDDQDSYVELGLIKAVPVPTDTPMDDRCPDCDGECTHCYRDTWLIRTPS
jgi:hypothetical protein